MLSQFSPSRCPARRFSAGAVPLGGEAFQPFVYAPPENPTAMTQFSILGTDAQLLQVVLAPGASVRAEPGALCFMADGVDVQTRLEGGLFGVIGRFFAGEGVWQNTLVRRNSLPSRSAPVRLPTTHAGGEPGR